MLRDFFIPADFAEPMTPPRRHESYAKSGGIYESAQLSVGWVNEFLEKFRRPALGFGKGSKAWQERAIKAWAHVARDWQAMKFRGAKSVLAALAAATDLSPQMLQEGLYNHFCVCGEETFKDWLAAIKHERDRNAERKTGHPALVFLVNAGNIPGVAIHPVMQLSLLGIPIMVKNVSTEPFLLPAILASLANYDPAVAARSAALTWARSASELTEAVMLQKPALAAFGDDDTMAYFARRKKHFADFGDRFSLALVSSSAAKSLPPRLAYDVCMFEQRGCLSPQAIFLLYEDWQQVHEFCGQLAAAMEKMCRQFPIGQRAPAQQAAIQQWRGALAVRAAGEKIVLLTSAGTEWTVAAAEHFDLNERVAYRFARVWPVQSIAQALTIFRQHKTKLQSIALGFSYQERQQLLRDFPDFGDDKNLLHTSPGYMQRPPFGWLSIHKEWEKLTLGLRREAGAFAEKA
jgi:hypothetical protein